MLNDGEAWDGGGSYARDAYWLGDSGRRVVLWRRWRWGGWRLGWMRVGEWNDGVDFETGEPRYGLPGWS